MSKAQNKGGRPIKINKKVRVAFSLSPEIFDFLNTLKRDKKTNRSKVIEDILRDFYISFKTIKDKIENINKHN